MTTPATITPMLDLARSVGHVPGYFVEMGILRGASFLELLAVAKSQRKRAIAIDSFRGMPESTEHDMLDDGTDPYPKGRFNVGGPRELFTKIRAAGFEECYFEIWEGFVPEILAAQVLDERYYSFAYIDLDHYASTAAALPWVWSRMHEGSVLACDDYVAANTGRLAMKAIEEFIEVESPTVVYKSAQQIAFRKGGA